mgnify:FL=1
MSSASDHASINRKRRVGGGKDNTSNRRSRTRKERDYYEYNSRRGDIAGKMNVAGRGGNAGVTSWATIACVFISITLLLATALGGLLYQSYEAKIQAHSRDMFLDTKSGGAAEAFMFLRDSKRTSIGVVRFYAEENNVRVVAELTSLKKNNEYGFHVYQYTDPVDNDIGEILNPKRKPHGCPGISAEFRMGDLGNIKANALGVAMYDSKMVGATIADIVGRSVVIHQHKDDCISQPIGNSGEFLAEGVVSLGNPSEIGSKLPKDNEQEGKMVAGVRGSSTGNVGVISKMNRVAPPPSARSSIGAMQRTQPQQQQQQQIPPGPDPSTRDGAAGSGGGIFGGSDNRPQQQQQKLRSCSDHRTSINHIFGN